MKAQNKRRKAGKHTAEKAAAMVNRRKKEKALPAVRLPKGFKEAATPALLTNVELDVSFWLLRMLW